MRARDALRLHKGDEVIDKKTGASLMVLSSPTIQHTYDPQTKKSEKWVIIQCVCGNTLTSRHHKEVR